MLHRFALRVLPSLTLAVTDEQTRRRKRLVMLVPGLVAFALYRAVKLFDPLHDPLAVLGMSGLISALAAICAYRIGRRKSFGAFFEEDGLRRVGWVIGWIGFVYGVQLSLLVLALLRVCAHYDFLVHPDGPAMMAIIIACTSVARDAFEIGHIRFLEREGKPVVTFPDGVPFRSLWSEDPLTLTRWLAVGMLVCGLAAWTAAAMGEVGRAELGQLAVITLVAGSFALVAYLAGRQPGRWVSLFRETQWSELLRFWWWPGLAFAATYYLVVLGVGLYVLRQDPMSGAASILIASLVGGIMALYCYYLGNRRHVEDRVQQAIPSSLLRCPFVMGILSKSKESPQGSGAPKGGPPSEIVVGQTGRS